MRWVMFYHSLVSDWNHGNAHFLRGIASELLSRGQRVDIFEPADGWSRQNLVQHHGAGATEAFHSVYPHLTSTTYSLDDLDLDRTLEDADVVLAHEWNDPRLIHRLGEHRRHGGDYQLLFHDTHHRLATAPSEMDQYDLDHFDGVLAFGKVIRDLYVDRGLHANVWTWHEAADVRVFRPKQGLQREGDLVWIGNWGDGERTEELQQFLLDPVRQLGLKAQVYGVRYPPEGRAALAAAGAQYGDWLPNHRVPEVFARSGATVHVPRRPYAENLPGIPTIRVFEALACGIPLITAPWQDAEGLFRPGLDYLVAQDGEQMQQKIRQVLHEPQLAQQLARSGQETIDARHTCRHRVDELLQVLRELGTDETALAEAQSSAASKASTVNAASATISTAASP